MLVDECNYAISDILRPEIIRNLSQDQLNDLIKKKCATLGWHWEDRVGTDGVTYTAFAPTIKQSHKNEIL